VQLEEAILLLETKEEVQLFLSDLCTPKELRSMKERWNVCQILSEEKDSYRDIHQITKASLTTIARVARFLREESYGGYRQILDRIKRGKDV
jgi:TrpR-related protein YerC/YecD